MHGMTIVDGPRVLGRVGWRDNEPYPAASRYETLSWAVGI